MKYYAGIGSRSTPKDILDLFEKLGEFLATKEYVLRSGHAEGADQSFETGCNKVNGLSEIYLPWGGFQGSNSNLIVESTEAFEIARNFHPYWYKLKYGGQKLQARNSHQVLGQDLKTPSDFIICWTKDGNRSGGTGQALRIGKAYGIPIFDAGVYRDIDIVKMELKIFLQENKVIEEKIHNEN